MSTSANPRSTPDAPHCHGLCGRFAPGTSRASAPAVVVRGALGVTMSSRPGLLRCARPGTHRATGLGVPATARRLLPLPLKRQPQPQTLALRSRAGWTARLRWGGRALSAADAGIKGAPSSPRSSSGGGLAPRQFQSHSCWRRAIQSSSRVPRHGYESPVLAPWRFVLVASSCGRSATVRRPPKVSRSMFRVPAEPGILTSSGIKSLPPAAPIAPAPSGLITQAACLPLRGLRSFVAASALKKVFVGRQGQEPRKRQKGSGL